MYVNDVNGKLDLRFYFVMFTNAFLHNTNNLRNK